MLTPRLEQLILSGAASYRTFVAGGTNRHILNVGSDRFIIITDLTFFNFAPKEPIDLNNGDLKKAFELSLFQVRIKSYKSENTFVFRNNFQVTKDNQGANHLYIVSPLGSTKLDTYLIHTNDVAIIFSLGESQNVLNLEEMPSAGVGFPRVSDYAKIGMKDPIKTLNRSKGPTGAIHAPGGDLYASIPATDPVYKEFVFPVDPITDPIQLTGNQWSTPLLQIGYVEILGNPTNIAATI
jgi:hypothetical protein